LHKFDIFCNFIYSQPIVFPTEIAGSNDLKESAGIAVFSPASIIVIWFKKSLHALSGRDFSGDPGIRAPRKSLLELPVQVELLSGFLVNKNKVLFKRRLYTFSVIIFIFINAISGEIPG
jgi:hypothetical protein